MHAALGAEQLTPRRAEAPATAAPTLAAGLGQQNLMKELQSMKELIEDRFNTLAWLGQARQNPIQSTLMLKLIRAGYSPALSRAVLEHLPEHLGAQDAVRWLMEVLERNLRTDAQTLPLYEEGGIFAMVGATGVGKTTTTAKLAALCARIHGPASVGLITLDTYRVGAHEQLRSYGRMLGVVAHLAHDRAALNAKCIILGVRSGDAEPEAARARIAALEAAARSASTSAGEGFLPNFMATGSPLATSKSSKVLYWLVCWPIFP